MFFMPLLHFEAHEFCIDIIFTIFAWILLKFCDIVSLWCDTHVIFEVSVQHPIDTLCLAICCWVKCHVEL
jgi:F0F1-type ATP synthase membrane subunit a